MSDKSNSKSDSKGKSLTKTGGYQPLKKGYSPTQSNLNPKNPPKGGSGVGKSGKSNTPPSKK